MTSDQLHTYANKLELDVSRNRLGMMTADLSSKEYEKYRSELKRKPKERLDMYREDPKRFDERSRYQEAINKKLEAKYNAMTSDQLYKYANKLELDVSRNRLGMLNESIKK
jgi:post-segregation antitoxin (ccd killing protein)